MQITIIVPDDINAEQFKEFAMVYVKRHIERKKETEIEAIKNTVITDLDSVRVDNGLKTTEESKRHSSLPSL